MRKQTEAGFALCSTKIIVDPESDGNPLFWQEDGKIHNDVFGSDTDWAIAMERAIEHGCPTYYHPTHTFERYNDRDPVLTMLYPIPITKEMEWIVGRMKALGGAMEDDSLKAAIEEIRQMGDLNYGFSTLDGVLDDIAQFCLLLPVPKLIPFGHSEAEYWGDELRGIYDNAKVPQLQ